MPASSADVAIRAPPIPAMRSISFAALGEDITAVKMPSIKIAVKCWTLKHLNSTISLSAKKYLQGQRPQQLRFNR